MYVIGDSHTRSFSYHEFFVPLFVGPGKETLFLTDEQTKKTHSKVLNTVKLLDLSQDYLFIFSEPNLRYHQQNKFNTRRNKDDQSVIKKIVANYVCLLKEVSSIVNGRTFVLCAIPRPDSDYTVLATMFNAELKAAVQGTKITYIDLWGAVTTNEGMIKPKFMGDFIHANYLLADMVVRHLKQQALVGKHTKVVSRYQWEHAHTIKSAAGEIRIWGDFDRKELVFRQNKPRNWSMYHTKTKIIDRALRVINLLLLFRKQGRLCVLGAKEGYVPFRLNPGKYTVIDALEDNAIKRGMARSVAGLYNAQHVNFLSKKEVGSEIHKKGYTSVICMEDFGEVIIEWDDLIFSIVENADYLFLLSRNESLDLDKLTGLNKKVFDLKRFKLTNGAQSRYLFFLHKKQNIFYRFIFRMIGGICKNINQVELRGI